MLVVHFSSRVRELGLQEERIKKKEAFVAFSSISKTFFVCKMLKVRKKTNMTHLMPRRKVADDC